MRQRDQDKNGGCRIEELFVLGEQFQGKIGTTEVEYHCEQRVRDQQVVPDRIYQKWAELILDQVFLRT